MKILIKLIVTAQEPFEKPKKLKSFETISYYLFRKENSHYKKIIEKFIN